MSNTKVTHHTNGNIKTIMVEDNGRFHNPSDPAFQQWYENGQELLREYWIAGKEHNLSGPAVQKWYENGQEWSRTYWIDGKRHNTSGPAIKMWDENGQEEYREYWIDGEELTKEEFEAQRDTVEIQVEGKLRISRMLVGL